MIFDLTKINLLDFTRSLIAFAEPKGIAQIEKEFKKNKNELVDSITESEFSLLISEFNNAGEGTFQILDYYKGNPIKLTLKKMKNGQIIYSSLSYDSRNQKYKVLEILLELFSEEDYKIIQKSYGQFEQSHFEKNQENPNRIKEFKNLINNAKKIKYDYGHYYEINASTYSSKLLKNII